MRKIASALAALAFFGADQTALAVNIAHTPEPRHWIHSIGGSQALILLGIALLAAIVVIKLIVRAVSNAKK